MKIFLTGLVSSLIMALAIVFASLSIPQSNSTVTVKGVSEVPVKSDLATWQIALSNSGNNSNELYSQFESNEKTIKQFLISQGFKESDISLNSTTITTSVDLNSPKFNVYGGIIVTTKNVDLVFSTSNNLSSLIKQNILINNSYVSYYFTDITSIKNKLLEQSISNAIQSAQSMNSNFKMNKNIEPSLKSATQGVISINSPDGANQNDTTSLFKIVRMVTTATFYVQE